MRLTDVKFSSRNRNESEGQKSLLFRLHLDLPLLIGLLMLAGTSLIILYSAGGQDISIIYPQNRYRYNDPS